MSSTINTHDDYTIGLNSYHGLQLQQKFTTSPSVSSNRQQPGIVQHQQPKEMKKVYPPIKLSQKTTTSLSNKLVSPIKSKVKMVQPGRLFMRMPVKNEEEKLLFSLGEFRYVFRLCHFVCV